MSTYEERWLEAVARGEYFGVYVPAGEAFDLPRGWAQVAPGSAIIGRDTHEERIECCYEGDIYATGMTFAQKADHAGARLVTQYPTVAKGWFPREELRRIGTWIPQRGLAIDDTKSLEAWEALS